MKNVIETSRLRLICADEAMLAAAIKGGNSLRELMHVDAANPWTENDERVFRYSLDKILSKPEEQFWWTYFHLLKDENKLTGTCGFKGKPDGNGMVEIGYEVARDYRRMGLATELAAGLIRFAFSNEAVMLICAHTLPEENASVGVLKKNGFHFNGESRDDDVGIVWRWDLHRENILL